MDARIPSNQRFKNNPYVHNFIFIVQSSLGKIVHRARIILYTSFIGFIIEIIALCSVGHERLNSELCVVLDDQKVSLLTLTYDDNSWNDCIPSVLTYNVGNDVQLQGVIGIDQSQTVSHNLSTVWVVFINVTLSRFIWSL